MTQAEKEWLSRHPVLRWGADPEWPPFSSFDQNGRIIGIDADITRLVAERVGLQLLPVKTASWAEVLTRTHQGEVDLLSATSRSPERLETFEFTAAYGSFPVVIITRDETPFLISPVDLHGLTVAMPRDHITTWQLKRDYPESKLIVTETAKESLELVATGKADATVQNLAVATRIIRLNGLTNLKISGVTSYSFPLRFAVPRGNPELVNILNKGLNTITRKDLAEIYGRHLTPDVLKAMEWATWRRRALYILVTAGVLFALVLFWNLTLAREIRKRKQTEAALLQSRTRLEQRTAELQAANENLEFFSGSVAHDLRAPLRRIKSYAELLEMDAARGDQSQAPKYTSIICREAGRMDGLIRDLLDYARLGERELHQQPVNMNRIVNEVIDVLRAQTKDRMVTWDAGALGEVVGDPDLIRLALTNLLENAVKYTSRCDAPKIEVGRIPERDTEEAFAYFVRDNGCGFDMNRAGALFTPFQRLHSPSEYSGTGMGLASVQKIISRHGGTVWFESEPDKGATFYFTLPRPRPTETPP